MCMSACPYTGVRSFNWEEPKHAIGHAMGDADVATHQKHVVEKCTMCWHRLADGDEPACIRLCPERARFWGDLDAHIRSFLQQRTLQEIIDTEKHSASGGNYVELH